MNGNKKINNLKKLIVLISIAILIVGVILVMSIYNNRFAKDGDDGIRGGRKAGTTTEEVLYDPDSEEETTETTTTEPSTEETTTTSVKPGDTTTTTVKTTKIKTTVQTVAPTTGSTVITQPSKNYTIVTSGGTGVSGSQFDLEWEMFNYINSKRGKKFKMAAELRSRAETAAQQAVQSLEDSINNDGCCSANPTACKCNFGDIKFDGAAYCGSERKSASYASDKIMAANTGIYDEDYEYIGIGVIRNSANHYSYVVMFD